MLKTESCPRSASSLRAGATAAKAGWKRGAKRKAAPASPSMFCDWPGSISMGIPKASSTSAPPLFDVIPRLPCLTRRAPAPAATNMTAVETLNSPSLSPPVPQTSITGRRPAGTSNGTACPKNSSAKAVISPGVSPRRLNAPRKEAFASAATDASRSQAATARSCSRVSSPEAAIAAQSLTAGSPRCDGPTRGLATDPEPAACRGIRS